MISRALALVLAGCGGRTADLPPTGQILLYIDTDAPVPVAPGSSAEPARPRALVDRVRVDVLRRGMPVPDVVSLAQRDFPLHQGRFAQGPMSIGIVPQPGDALLTVHVRMFQSDRLRGGEPDPNATLDAEIALPAVAAEGKVDVAIFLPLSEVGKPRAAAAALPARTSGASRVGTSPLASRLPCNGVARPEEACVAGGAYWMGDPDLRGIPDLGEADRQRLVVLSAFYLDRTEVTVGAYRTFFATEATMGFPPTPVWNGKLDATALDSFSTFTPSASSADPDDLRAKLPVLGVAWPSARAYCQSLGKDLPTEAHYELVATDGGRVRYPWGVDPPTCSDAVLARAGVGVYQDFPGDCRDPIAIGGVAPPGTMARDAVVFGGAAIVDLAGNASEWMRDVYVGQTELPWSTQGYVQDPVATTPGPLGDLRSSRGGSWRAPWLLARASVRDKKDPQKPNRSMGFRCARTP